MSEARPPRTYAAVTPARNERERLPRLFESLAGQTVRPSAWVIAENGSTDGTAAFADGLAAEHDWIGVVHTEAGARYDRGGTYMRAFHAGVAALPIVPDVLVKLDADVSFDATFFESIVEAFAGDPSLGITSGSCWEPSGSSWRQRPIVGDHVWGPTRSYRWPQLSEIFPLEEALGYAQVDEAKAQLLGWTTRTLHELPFRHHRPEGQGEGSRLRAWFSEGQASHYMAYRPSYLLARTLYRAVRDPAAVAIPAGYVAAALRREPQCRDLAVLRAIRSRQRLRWIVRRALGG
jgi:glycosyltransferase involved in cell wall biosynthesis